MSHLEDSIVVRELENGEMESWTVRKVERYKDVEFFFFFFFFIHI